MSKEEGVGRLASWQARVMYDLLIQRANAGVQTIVYATNYAAIGETYGLATQRVIDARFVKVEI